MRRVKEIQTWSKLKSAFCLGPKRQETPLVLLQSLDSNRDQKHTVASNSKEDVNALCYTSPIRR